MQPTNPFILLSSFRPFLSSNRPETAALCSSPSSRAAVGSARRLTTPALRAWVATSRCGLLDSLNDLVHTGTP